MILTVTQQSILSSSSDWKAHFLLIACLCFTPPWGPWLLMWKTSSVLEKNEKSSTYFILIITREQNPGGGAQSRLNLSDSIISFHNWWWGQTFSKPVQLSTFKTTKTWMTENLHRRDRQIHCFSDHLSKWPMSARAKKKGNISLIVAIIGFTVWSYQFRSWKVEPHCSVSERFCAPGHMSTSLVSGPQYQSQLLKAEAGGFTVLPDICDVQMLSSLRGNQRPLLRNTHTAVASRCSDIIIIMIVLLSRFASGIWDGKPY